MRQANVLVDRWGHVALCDFGIAAIYAEGFTHLLKRKKTCVPFLLVREKRERERESARA